MFKTANIFSSRIPKDDVPIPARFHLHQPPAQPTAADDVPLGRVLELAEAGQPSRLPLRA